ncbi:DNA-binding protein [Undibacterium sp. Ji49W]|uniref:DNA-binding protein n=1 Tax=Undibacterium sp. Ji49W TaxID=3413040 RepID=UPI003BF0ED6D
MKPTTLKTAAEVLSDFATKGISISQWAHERNLPPSVVYGVLKGKRKARIGKSHKAAVLLGLKHGEIVD